MLVSRAIIELIFWLVIPAKFEGWLSSFLVAEKPHIDIQWLSMTPLRGLEKEAFVTWAQFILVDCPPLIVQ